MTVAVVPFWKCNTISTHILTKRMTGDRDRSAEDGRISTHILTKRMTRKLINRSWCIGYFNSHPHEEDDRIRRQPSEWYRYFNSHPHEEDDGVSPQFIRVAMHFNSHPHEEDDAERPDLRHRTEPFQLTSSRRGWPFIRLFSTAIFSFQLTSSRRGWHFGSVYVVWISIISTHILTKRMTVIHLLWDEYNTFQLTSSRRGWQVYDDDLILIAAFQLTSSRRGWRRNQDRLQIYHHFNSHPHEEDD